jgi:hypothetical protein
VEAAGVDPPGAAANHGRTAGGAKDQRVELLPSFLGVLLRIVEARERSTIREREALEIELDGGRDERACEAAAARLIGARYEAPLERAIEGKESPAAARSRRLAARWLRAPASNLGRPPVRARRCGREAST